MKTPVSLEELTNTYCLLITNSYRLVEDAERIAEQKRFLSAVASCAAAIQEIIKSHLVMHAVILKKTDTDQWEWFWTAWGDLKTRLEFLKKEIHPRLFRNKKDEEEFEDVMRVLRGDFVSVQFDEEKKIFLPPGQTLSEDGRDRQMSQKIYTYTLSLYKALNIHGLPNPPAQFRIFSYLKQSGEIPPPAP